MQKLEQIAYQAKPAQIQPQQQLYTSNDLGNLSAGPLYSDYIKPDGTFDASGNAKSGFGKDFGLKKGYVFDTLEIDNTPIQMRLRADDAHKGFEKPHLNLEYYKKGKTKPFLNEHLDIDWKDKK